MNEQQQMIENIAQTNNLMLKSKAQITVSSK